MPVRKLSNTTSQMNQKPRSQIHQYIYSTSLRPHNSTNRARFQGPGRSLNRKLCQGLCCWLIGKPCRLEWKEGEVGRAWPAAWPPSRSCWGKIPLGERAKPWQPSGTDTAYGSAKPFR